MEINPIDKTITSSGIITLNFEKKPKQADLQRHNKQKDGHKIISRMQKNLAKLQKCWPHKKSFCFSSKATKIVDTFTWQFTYEDDSTQLFKLSIESCGSYSVDLGKFKMEEPVTIPEFNSWEEFFKLFEEPDHTNNSPANIEDTATQMGLLNLHGRNVASENESGYVTNSLPMTIPNSLPAPSTRGLHELNDIGGQVPSPVADPTPNNDDDGIQFSDSESEEDQITIEFDETKQVLKVDNKEHSAERGVFRLLVEQQKNIGVLVKYPNIEIYHKNGAKALITRPNLTPENSECCLFRKESMIWMAICTEKKLLVYDTQYGTLIKVFHLAVKENVVQWDCVNGHLVLLTRDNNLYVIDNFDNYVDNINVSPEQIKNRMAVLLKADNQGENFEIPVEKGEESNAICRTFGYEEGDFYTTKKHHITTVTPKNNVHVKLNKIKPSKLLWQNVDCFTIEDSTVIAHGNNNEGHQLGHYQLSENTSPNAFSFTTVSFGYPSTLPCLIKGPENRYIIYKFVGDKLKLVVFDTDPEAEKPWKILNLQGLLVFKVDFISQHKVKIALTNSIDGRFDGTFAEVDLQKDTLAPVYTYTNNQVPHLQSKATEVKKVTSHKSK
jgi:hypothetical protein